MARVREREIETRRDESDREQGSDDRLFLINSINIAHVQCPYFIDDLSESLPFHFYVLDNSLRIDMRP